MLPYLALTPALRAGEPAPILNIRSVQEVLNLRDTQSTAAITNPITTNTSSFDDVILI